MSKKSVEEVLMILPCCLSILLLNGSSIGSDMSNNGNSNMLKIVQENTSAITQVLMKFNDRLKILQNNM